ncbi:MAG: hypothetical protein K8R21_03090, partial [Leptospira sp.]|nr:hypothetical protein [Leptospira sp.]
MLKNKSSLPFIILLITLFIFSDLFSQAPAEENPNAIKELDETKSNPNAGKISKSKDGSLSFTADWRNTEIKDFLKGMSAIIKKNILIDDAIKGKKITIISQTKVNVKDAF